MAHEVNGHYYFTAKELAPLFKDHDIVDGTKGGLILGNSLADEGIMVINQFSKDFYQLILRAEGYQYLMHPQASKEDLEYLRNINDEFKDAEDMEFTEYKVPEAITFINTQAIALDGRNVSRLLLIGDQPQFIVNRHASKKYLKELEALNKLYCG